MLSFPDSNSFNDYENSFKFTFRLEFVYVDYTMGCSDMHASSKKKIQKILEDLAKNL